MLLHLKKGSVRVKVGQMVITDQELAKVGCSGDAIYPHLHYMVTNGRKMATADGLPSYFNNYRLYRGENVSSVKRSRIDSGDIVEALN
jgi:murein DD-endopeptidase MepM/ murein hydrolase activator NlpD